MREILFRGKRIDNGEWAYSRCPDGTLYSGVVKHDFIPETIGQYTGLIDKNGKRIYEGDICRNTRNGDTVSVKWHGTMAGYVCSKRKSNSILYDFGELFRAYDKYEVIGNIHDNPELLEDDNVRA